MIMRCYIKTASVMCSASKILNFKFIMAKENSYNVLAKPTAKRGRNAFNLNNQHVYSMKAGLINPVKAVHFMPGDYFKLKASDFTITFPMNSAPFLRARKEFSFYSVYYSAVWSLFNQFMAGRQDPKTSAFGQTPVLQEPRIKLLNLYASVFNQFGCYIFLEYYLPTWVVFYNKSNNLGKTDDQLSVIIKNAVFGRRIPIYVCLFYRCYFPV